LYGLVGLRFAAAFAVLITIGQVIAYVRGIRPALDYAAARRAGLSQRQFSATIIRIIGYIAAALACSAFVTHLEHPWRFAIQVGLVTGLTTGIGAAVIPFIEYYADSLPERRLGAFGVGLILCGFAMQSLQYWLSLLDVRVT
jgi:MFS family permease